MNWFKVSAPTAACGRAFHALDINIDNLFGFNQYPVHWKKESVFIFFSKDFKVETFALMPADYLFIFGMHGYVLDKSRNQPYF